MMDEQMAALLQAAREYMRAIADILMPFIRDVIRNVARVYRQLRMMHAIPRQYRDTMTKRKLRRLAK